MSKEPAILNHAPHRPRGRTIAFAALSALMTLGMLKAFGTAPSTAVFTGRVADVVEQVVIPTATLIKSDEDSHSREIRIQRSDTVSGLLSGMDIHDEDALDFLRSNRETETLFRQLAPGKTLTAKVASDGGLQSLAFPLNGGKDTALLIHRTPQGFTSDIQPLPFETTISHQSAVIRHSLFGAVDDAGMPDSVAAQLADIFGGDIDFHRDLRKGDRFSVIYETVSHLGKPIRTQRILAAEFINGGKAYRAFWHQVEGGVGGYYTSEGQNIKKAFLRSPLEFSRITSGFSTARYHPVLRETRAHRGIDYGAPTGTRVKATGDGVIDFAGIQGGYGKVVMIRHPGDRMTVYGHLSGFAAGIKKGAHIAQGDVIGFVGATGIATGPHLHYEFRIAGVHRNPLSVVLPSGLPLPPAQRPAFSYRVADLMSQIEAIKDMRLVMLD
jgi:murein DD-endopeptidase MepM/ murein hydrolase activator NlpD